MAAKDAPTRKRRTIKGVEEFDEAKLGPLLKRKYHKAIADLGTPDSVRQAFVGFQRHLYQGGAATSEPSSNAYNMTPARPHARIALSSTGARRGIPEPTTRIAS